MLNSLRKSIGAWSPTKKPLSLPNDEEAAAGGSQELVQHGEEQEPSVWGHLEVENKHGKVTGGLPLTERECNIGRSSDNDIRLCEIGVSRHACRVHFDRPGQARLQLLGSTKVIVNDCHILPLPDSDEPVSVLLSSEDLIIIHKYRFRFRYAEAASSSRNSPTLVPSSPAEHRRASLAQLTTPSGKRRRVRMSLVRAAEIDTPAKAEAVARDLEELEEEEEGGFQASPLRKGPAELLASPRRRSLEQEGEDDHEEVLVIDDGVEEEPEGDAMDVDVPAEPEKPASPTKKDCRRSSFLGRAWPFGSSSQDFYAEERQATPAKAAEPEEQEEREEAEDEDEDNGDEDNDIENQSPWRNGSPRLPHSQSSPGRLVGSPSFLNHGRRNLSLRTKTLLKHSAALAERLENEALMGSAKVSPSRPSPLQEDASVVEEPEAEEALAAEQEEQSRISDANVNEVAQDDGAAFAADQDDEDEVDKSLSLGVDQSMSLEEEPAPLPSRPLQPLSLKSDLPSFVVTERAAKRQSMPVAVKRRSLFGFLPIRPSKEAEDVEVGTVYRSTSDEAREEAPIQVAPIVSPTIAFESLRAPAREALRYLLSNKTWTPSAAASPTLSEPAAPRYGMLRELMLGRPENVALLDQTRKTTKRGSLILAASSAQISPVPVAELTPDVIFLRHIFKLPQSETDTDPQLKSARDVFDEFAFMLVDESTEEADDEDREDFADFLVSPAARRVLLKAASTIARLSPDEAAVQSAALITSLQEVEAAAAAQGENGEEPRRRKTRRGCRGGRRRGKSSSSFAQLTGQDGVASAAGEMPEVVEVAEGEAEAAAAIADAEAPAVAQETTLEQPQEVVEPIADEQMQEAESTAVDQQDATMAAPADEPEEEMHPALAPSSPPSTPPRRRRAVQTQGEMSSPLKSVSRMAPAQLDSSSPLKSSRKANDGHADAQQAEDKTAAVLQEEEKEVAQPESPVKRSPVKAPRTPRRKAAQVDEVAREEASSAVESHTPAVPQAPIAAEEPQLQEVASSPAPARSTRRKAAAPAAATTSQSSPAKPTTRGTRGGRHKKNASSKFDVAEASAALAASVADEVAAAAANDDGAQAINGVDATEEGAETKTRRGTRGGRKAAVNKLTEETEEEAGPSTRTSSRAATTGRGRKIAKQNDAGDAEENEGPAASASVVEAEDKPEDAPACSSPLPPAPAPTKRGTRGGAKKGTAVKAASSPIKPSTSAPAAKRTTRGAAAAATTTRSKRGQRNAGADDDEGGEEEEPTQMEPHSEPSPPTLRTRSGRRVRKV